MQPLYNIRRNLRNFLVGICVFAVKSSQSPNLHFSQKRKQLSTTRAARQDAAPPTDAQERVPPEDGQDIRQRRHLDRHCTYVLY